jgi:hypothetical protein
MNMLRLALCVTIVVFSTSRACEPPDMSDVVAQKWKQFSTLREDPFVRLTIRLREGMPGKIQPPDYDARDVTTEIVIEVDRYLRAAEQGIQGALVTPPSESVTATGLLPFGEIEIETKKYKQRILMAKVGFSIDDGNLSSSSNTFYSVILAGMIDDILRRHGKLGLPAEVISNMNGDAQRKYEIGVLEKLRAK